MKTDMLIEYLFVGGSYDGEKMRIDHEYGPYSLPPKNIGPVIQNLSGWVSRRPEPLEEYDRKKLIYGGKLVEVFIISSMRPEKYEHDLKKIYDTLGRFESI